MVLQLAERLDVPLRDRNRLLLAAGYAPEFAQHDLDAPEMGPVRDALEQLLRAHEPYPALVIDAHWGLVAANRAVEHLIEGAAAHLLEPPVNVLRLSLHPKGVAPRIVNLYEWRAHLLERLARDAAQAATRRSRRCSTSSSSYPAGEPGTSVDPAFADVAVPLRLRHGDGDLAFISTRTTFGPRSTSRRGAFDRVVLPCRPSDEETMRSSSLLTERGAHLRARGDSASRGAAAETRERAVGADHTVAGQDDRQRVAPWQRHGTRGVAGEPEPARLLPVAHCLPAWNRRESEPATTLEIGSLELERQVDVTSSR